MKSSARFDFDVQRYGEVPRLNGLMVVGTDTGVGKTLIAGAIARRLVAQGVRVEVFKPAATGCERVGGRFVPEDTAFLACNAESQLTLSEITPIMLKTPAAPNVSARHENKRIDLDEIFNAYRHIAKILEQDNADQRCVIVEGVGGLMCPISDDFLVIHVALALRLPVVIVAHAGLGTINHTLLTAHAARNAGLDVAGIVINKYITDTAALGDNGIVMETNPGEIQRFSSLPILAIVPAEESNNVSDSTIGEDTMHAISMVDWMTLAGR